MSPILAQPTRAVDDKFLNAARAASEAFSEPDNPKNNYRLVKERLSRFSALSCYHPDSITRRGEKIIVRHLVGNSQPWNEQWRRDTISDWHQMLVRKIPEAEIYRITFDPDGALRAHLFIYHHPLVPCRGGCGSRVYPDSEFERMCLECWLSLEAESEVL